MSTTIGLLLALSGLVIYAIKPQWLFLFWMLTWPILSPILCLIGGLNDPDSANDFLYRQSGFFAYTFLMIIILNAKKLGCVFTNNKKVFASLFLLSMYFIIHSLITHFSVQQIYLNIKTAVYIILPYLVLIIDKRTIPSSKALYILISLIMAVEIVFVYLNNLGINAYLAWYISSLEFPEYSGLATGTFYGSARFPDYCAMVFMFLTVDFFSRRRIPLYQYIILAVICIICLLAAGSRLPIALASIILFATVFLYGKQYKAILLTSVAVGYLGLLFLSSYSGGEISENDGVNRIVNGLSGFTQSKKYKDEDHSTVRLSEKLLDEYFWRSPIVGNGRACLGENAYPIADHVSDTSDFKADAHLAFMLVEYGVLGVILYFLLFIRVLKNLTRTNGRHDKRILIVMFFYTILSITEGGLWDSNLFPYAYLYFLSTANSVEVKSIYLNESNHVCV